MHKKYQLNIEDQIQYLTKKGWSPKKIRDHFKTSVSKYRLPSLKV